MAVYKNKSSQKLLALAWDTANNVAKTGDAANITALLFNDGGAVGTATDDTNPTELGTSGVYAFDATQAESNFDSLTLVPVSATADIQLDPVVIYTQPEIRDTGTSQNTLSVPNPSGGTVALASSVGTTDLSLSVTGLTFDGTNVNANVEKVSGEDTNNGVTWDAYFKKSLSQLIGTIHKNGDVYTFLDQVGGTSMVLTSGTDIRTVA